MNAKIDSTLTVSPNDQARAEARVNQMLELTIKDAEVEGEFSNSFEEFDPRFANCNNGGDTGVITKICWCGGSFELTDVPSSVPSDAPISSDAPIADPSDESIAAPAIIAGP